MTAYGSLPFWRELTAHARVTVWGRSPTRQTYRIEFASVPILLAERALAHRAPCCACGAPSAPIRCRAKNWTQKRQQHILNGLYYAPSCPLHVNVGCSRGDAAHSDVVETVRLIRDTLESPPRAPFQAGLFGE